MRQILKILLQPHIKLRKCLNINFLRHFQSLMGEVSYKQFSNIVQIIFTQNRKPISIRRKKA